MLTPSLHELQASVKGTLGRELLAELYATLWDRSTFQAIEPLGVAYGFTTGAKRPRNEDRLAVAQINSMNRVRYAIAILCDGVGGSQNGDLAATIAIATILGGMAEARAPVSLEKLLESLIRSADDSVRSALKGSGATTLSVVAISSDGEFGAANVGDSRIFAWTPGGRSLKQISVDDTFENELRDVVDQSALEAHGLRGALTQAIGERDRESNDLRVKIFPRENFPAGAILASDGAWKADALAFKLINTEAKTATDVVRRTLAFAGWAGGLDNTSLLAIEDLDLFSNFNDQSKRDGYSPSSTRLTSWVAGQNIVMSHLFVPNHAPQLFQDNKAIGTQPPKEKPKRKSTARRKVSVKPTPPAEQELDLNTEPQTTKNPTDRPQMEISTEEENPEKS